MSRAGTLTILLLFQPFQMAPSHASELRLAATVHETGRLAREPMVVRHPDGTLFLSGYGSQVTGTDPRAAPLLWKSEDGGDTWATVDVGSPADGAIGNSDVDLTVGPDGSVYFASMGFDRSTFQGTHVALGESRDVGKTWRWTLLSETRFDDRPWVRIAPDGTAHVVWNDDQGVHHAVRAKGETEWVERNVHPQGGSSHLAVGPKGELALRISPIGASGNRYAEGVDLLAISEDAGASWKVRDAPGDREWDRTFANPEMIPRWVEPVAWDSRGRLYSFWSSGSRLHLARSSDRGETWDDWTVAEDEARAFFPYLVAGPSDALAATWFQAGADSMVAHAATISLSASEPVVARSPALPVHCWREGTEPPVRDSCGEYLPVVWLDPTSLGVAVPIQDGARGRFGFSWYRLERKP